MLHRHVSQPFVFLVAICREGQTGGLMLVAVFNGH